MLLIKDILANTCLQIGGAENHRIGLYDMLLIKDNHIAAAGGIAAAVKGAEVLWRGRSVQFMARSCALCGTQGSG